MNRPFPVGTLGKKKTTATGTETGGVQTIMRESLINDQKSPTNASISYPFWRESPRFILSGEKVGVSQDLSEDRGTLVHEEDGEDSPFSNKADIT